jgi:hypothetical protein
MASSRGLVVENVGYPAVGVLIVEAGNQSPMLIRVVHRQMAAGLLPPEIARKGP